MFKCQYKKPFRILLVDDNHMTLKIMSNFLENTSYEVFMESNAENSLKLMEKQEIDIIFSDHSMPGMTGIDFLEKIARTNPEIIRVLVTGKADFSDLIYAINNADLYRVIIKPINRLDFISIVETAEEISNKRYLEALLIQSEKRFENLINSMLDAVIVTTPDGDVKYVNPFAEKIWGVPQEEFARNNFSLPSATGDSTEIDILSPDKTLRIGDLRTYDIFWHGEKALLNVIRDITERKEIEDQLKETIEKLSRANDTILEQQKLIIEEEKLDILLQMSGATAHELSQPLTVLMGNIEILKYKDGKNSLNIKHIDSIYSAAEKISSIVRKFQAIRHVDSKKYAGNTQIINIDQILKILFISENIQSLREIDDIFKQMDIDLKSVYGIDEAKQIFERESFDLIILENNHNNKDCLLLQRYLMENNIESGLIVILRESDPELLSELFENGVVDILQKSEITPSGLKGIVYKNFEISKLKKELRLKRDKLLKLSHRDINTGLYNHSFLLETLKNKIGKVKNGRGIFSLSMLKIEEYTTLKNKYSEKEITKLVKIFSQNLEQIISDEKNSAFIYDQNLFTVIVPDTTPEKAELLIDEIKSNIENISFFIGNTAVKISLKSVTVSSKILKNPTEKELLEKVVSLINES